ncbi:MAG TPA: prepilin peptidase-dependent protein, partial [Erwinia persicina]|nr:prepilin peptidase-dependent protein [Erwinia persicina]
MPVKSQGFTLLETLIALAVSSILMVGAMRTLPQLQSQNL